MFNRLEHLKKNLILHKRTLMHTRTILQSLLVLIFIFTTNQMGLGQGKHPLILNEEKRAEVIDAVLEDRIDNLLPQLMERTNIDMWILVSREYNEDPVMKTMLPSTWLSARRRTIFVFYRSPEGEMDRIAIARYSVGKLLKGEWDIDVYPDQWDALTSIIEKRQPQKIGLNYSEDFGLADGLVKSEHEELLQAIGGEYAARIVSAEDLAIAWLETRSEKEIQIYDHICAIGHSILREGLSEKNIHPGITTTDDIVWRLRELVREAHLDTWFHPSVSIQRASTGNEEFLRSFSRRPEKDVVQHGDLLHVDFGITYLRLNTDQQEHFYVLKPEEKDAPLGLRKAFAEGRKLQDYLTSNFVEGRSGNQILKATLDQAKTAGMNASIYTHPIGFHGHAAGPTIGMWDQQDGVKGKGDYPLYKNTAYSIELFAASEVPEWGGKLVRIMLEQDGVFTGDSFYYLDGKQEKLHLIYAD